MAKSNLYDDDVLTGESLQAGILKNVLSRYCKDVFKGDILSRSFKLI